MVSADVLKELAGRDLFGDRQLLTVRKSSLLIAKDAVWGSLMKAFGSDPEGRRAGEAACRAIGALATVGQIDTMITNFLVPLQVLI